MPEQCTRFVLTGKGVFSHPLDEAVDHLFLPGLVEIDGELVAVDLHHMAIAELLVEDAHPDREARALGGARRHQRAVHRKTPGGAPMKPEGRPCCHVPWFRRFWAKVILARFRARVSPTWASRRSSSRPE